MWRVFLAAVVGGAVGTVAALSTQHWTFHLVAIGMSYAELAATLLAASALILAALGFFIAVLAVLGWSQFRGLVRKSATETVKAHIDSRIKDGDLRGDFEIAAIGFLDRQFKSGPLRKLIEQRVDQVIFGSSKPKQRFEGDENEED